MVAGTALQRGGTFEEHAQDGRGVRRPAERASEFLSSLAARNRALCALAMRLADRKLLHIENSAAAGQWLLAPASTVKPFSLLALMEAGKLRASDEFPCTRHLRIGSHTLDCVHPPAALPMNPARALAYSCNSAVAHFAQRFAPGELPAALTRYGFTSITNLLPNAEVPGEVLRNTSGPACQLQALGEEGIKVTPIGLLLAYARLTHRLTDPRYLPILEGLEGAVEFGTAQAAAQTHLKVAGKTGSINGAAWFAGFAPTRSPQYAVVVLVQGHSGGADAAPLAGALLRSLAKPTL